MGNLTGSLIRFKGDKSYVCTFMFEVYHVVFNVSATSSVSESSLQLL